MIIFRSILPLLFLNFNFPSAVLLREVLLVLLHLGLLNLYSLDLTSLQALLYALLCKLGSVLYIDGLKLRITLEAIRFDRLKRL